MKVNPDTPTILRNLSSRERNEILNVQSEIFIIEEQDIARANKLLRKHRKEEWIVENDDYGRRPLRLFDDLIDALTYRSPSKDERTQDVFDAFPELRGILAVKKLLRTFLAYDLVCRQQKILQGVVGDLIVGKTDEDENDDLAQMVSQNAAYFAKWKDEDWDGEELMLLEPVLDSNHWMLRDW